MSILSLTVKNELKKLTLPWLFARMGVGKWLRERFFRIPEIALPDVAQEAEERAIGYARLHGDIVTPSDRWRAVESVQADIVNRAFNERKVSDDHSDQ